MNRDLEIINSYIAPKEFDYRRGAFTLAEVLITLGIIGVVAAMTIPTLVSNYQKKVEETKYKKAKSVIVNNFKLLFAQENLTGYKNSSLEKCGQGTVCAAKEFRKVFRIDSDAWTYNSTSTGSNINLEEEMRNINYTAEDPNQKVMTGWMTMTDICNIFRTTDGMTYGYTPFEDSASFIRPEGEDSFYVQVDTNGPAGPNIVGRDFFKFKLDRNTNIFDVTSSIVSGECSRTTPGGCASQDACYALGDGATRYPGAGSQYMDENNNCYVYSWNTSANRCIARTLSADSGVFGNGYHYCQ